MTQISFRKRIRQSLADQNLQAALDANTVRHVSGIVSHCDWVTAASDAGYLFTTGNVAYAVMSMPPESRPAEYRDCQKPSACHDVFPAELEARLHPWRMIAYNAGR